LTTSAPLSQLSWQELLLRDVQHALSDVEFMLNDGTIHYAVDFSEIHAFAGPTDGDLKEMRLHPGEDGKIPLAAHELYAGLLFRGPLSTEPILLGPYAVELDYFLRGQMRRLDNGLGDSIDTAWQEVELLRNSDEGKEIQKLLANLPTSDSADDGAPPSSLTDDQRDLVVTYLRRNAGALTTLVRGAGAQNRTGEIVKLINDGRLTNLSAIFQSHSLVAVEEIRSNPELRDNLYKCIEPGRLPGRDRETRLDAEAMAIVAAANARLSSVHASIRLVTRSKAMFSGLDALRAVDPVAAVDIHLRQPRAYLASQARGPLDRAELQMRCFELDELRSAVTRLVNLEEIDGDLQNKLKELSDRWVAIISLQLPSEESTKVSLSADTTSFPGNENKQQILESSRKVLALAHSDSALRKAISERMAEEEALFLLSAQQLRDLSIPDKHEPARPLRISKNGGMYFAESIAFSMPISLELRTKAVKAYADRNEIGSWADLAKLRKSILQDNEPAVEVEVLNLFAFAFGALDRWSLSRSYARTAAFQSELTTESAFAHLLHALSLRKLTIESGLTSRERYHHAKEALDAASAKLSNDPRYLFEYATQWFYWSQHTERAIRTDADHRVEGALQACTTALNLLEKEPWSSSQYLWQAHRLKAFIHCNRCYFLTRQARQDANDLAARDYDELVRLKGVFGEYNTVWPPDLEDTMLYFEWQTRDEHANPEELLDLRTGIERDYYRLLARNDLPGATRFAVERHLDILRLPRHR
jgi:hypothetical protein